MLWRGTIQDLAAEVNTNTENIKKGLLEINLHRFLLWFVSRHTLNIHFNYNIQLKHYINISKLFSILSEIHQRKNMENVNLHTNSKI